MMPLPNVTGALHMGHALNDSLQDLLTRWRRMQGYEALWMPGTDHAGIATQAVVERRMLEEEGLTRHDVGREALVNRIWKWKDAYEERILGQLKQLGASCDWRRTRFTLDDICTFAVRRTFFKFFADGLIYRGKRLVNWDTYLRNGRRRRRGVPRGRRRPLLDIHLSRHRFGGADRLCDHAAGDDAGRHGHLRQPVRRPLSPPDRQEGPHPAQRPRDPDHRRRDAGEDGHGDRRGESDPRPTIPTITPAGCGTSCR